MGVPELLTLIGIIITASIAIYTVWNQDRVKLKICVSSISFPIKFDEKDINAPTTYGSPNFTVDILNLSNTPIVILGISIFRYKRGYSYKRLWTFKVFGRFRTSKSVFHLKFPNEHINPRTRATFDFPAFVAPKFNDREIRRISTASGILVSTSCGHRQRIRLNFRPYTDFPFTD